MDKVLNDVRITSLIYSLRTCRMFDGLLQSDLNSIAKITLIKRLEKGEYLFRQGQKSLGFYIVRRGTINVHRVTASGKERVIQIFRSGESFAEGAMATNTGYPAEARAEEQSEFLLVQKAGFLALMGSQPELAMRIIGSMSKHLQDLVGQIEDLTLRDVETRLANWLVKQCPKPLGNQVVEIELTMTKRVIAEELGTVPETLSRTFAKFRKKGLILMRPNTINILSPEKLGAFLSRNLGE